MTMTPHKIPTLISIAVMIFPDVPVWLKIILALYLIYTMTRDEAFNSFMKRVLETSVESEILAHYMATRKSPLKLKKGNKVPFKINISEEHYLVTRSDDSTLDGSTL